MLRAVALLPRVASVRVSTAIFTLIIFGVSRGVAEGEGKQGKEEEEGTWCCPARANV